jgi:hypothetical protein
MEEIYYFEIGNDKDVRLLKKKEKKYLQCKVYYQRKLQWILNNGDIFNDM